MRIMVDTNTLLSSVLFPHGITAQAMEFILKYHTLILPTYVIQEAKVVMERKFPSFSFALQQFIDSLSFELAFSIEESRADVQVMPDPKDIPILLSALREDIDCFVTRDKDFLSLPISKPEFLSLGDFLRKYQRK